MTNVEKLFLENFAYYINTNKKILKKYKKLKRINHADLQKKGFFPFAL